MMAPSLAWRTLTSFSVCLLFLLHQSPCHGGKVLVFPVDGSHWINMNVLIEELHIRGHSITVIRTTTSWYIKEKSPFYESITIREDQPIENVIDVFLDKNMKAQRERASALTYFKVTWEFMTMLSWVNSLNCGMISRLLDNHEVVKSLREAQFDLVLTDPADASGMVLAKYLQLPLVLNVRWITSGDAHFAIAPSPLSYIPVPGSGFTDKMTFTQRIKNVLMYIVILYQQKFLVGANFEAVCEKYIEGGCDITSLLQDADIWLFRSNFMFDFPKPTMPNVIYIGGFQCKPAQPLPSDLEEFVQSAGEHGVVIMSLGTLVNTLPKDIGEEIASVFAKLPQKVIWNYRGERPSTLGNNTLVINWMPQKDLLGHPQTRAFVAHGGTNGVQEAIYHGVPVLGIPLFFDQYDNLLRLQVRGAAKILQLADVNGPNFQQALEEVLHQDSYRQNMKSLSNLHRDQPIKPLDSAMFWLEFVMRNKGAPHLRTQAYKMPWFSYYSVDVLLVLLSAGVILLLSTAALLRLLCCRGCKKTKTKLQ